MSSVRDHSLSSTGILSKSGNGETRLQRSSASNNPITATNSTEIGAPVDIDYRTHRYAQTTYDAGGNPLNYFVNTCAKLDGKLFDKLRSHFAFHDLPVASLAIGDTQTIGN